jgi:holliday junction DNA helicase RuvB
MTTNVLRPNRFAEIVGQKDAITRLNIAIQAAKRRNESIPHILLGGSSPGIGKTTLAYAVANEYGSVAHYFNAPAIKKVSEIVNPLARVKQNDIVIIDEFHALNKPIAEILLPVLEDRKLTIPIVKRIVTVDMPPFTMIGCTTEVGTIIRPLRDRFGIQFNLQPYSDDEIYEIVTRSMARLNLPCPMPSLVAGNISKRSRGIPRVANRLLERVRDYADAYSTIVSQSVVDKAMELEGVDEAGFTDLDKKYVYTLYDTYQGGPSGLSTMASTIGEDSATVSDYIEPFLLRGGFIAITKQGRVLTEKGTRFAVDISRKDGII